MSEPAGASDNRPGRPARDPDATRTVEICNKRGLHARASAKFVQMAERFSAEITVTRGSETVGGNSIMGLMMLAAAPGTSITVTAKGPQAQEALDALTQLVNSRFGEED